jgi:hypothetical protein
VDPAGDGHRSGDRAVPTLVTMRRSVWAALLLLGSCSGGGEGDSGWYVGPGADRAWGLSCGGSQTAVVSIDPSESGGHKTPDIAVQRFLEPEGEPSASPSEGFPSDGWERADVVPTPSGTEPVTGTMPPQLGGGNLPTQAYVHRDDGRVDAVLVRRAQLGGWVVDAASRCAD